MLGWIAAVGRCWLATSTGSVQAAEVRMGIFDVGIA
jgi:hypothetical protein